MNRRVIPTVSKTEFNFFKIKINWKSIKPEEDLQMISQRKGNC